MYYKKKDNKPALIRKLDKVFSEFIRLRDSRPYGFRYFRCISCGEVKPFDKADCGHYFSRTHMATRFSEVNCNAECSYCNRFKADHLIGYRENLIKKIGRPRFDILTFEATQTKKWSSFEIESLIKHYKQRIKDLRNG